MSKELKAYIGPAPDEKGLADYYLKSDADKVIAEKDKEIAKLKDKCQMHDFFWEGCGFAKRGFKNTIAVREAFDRIEAENKRLKKQASCTFSDDCLRVRQLKRKLAGKNEKILELQKAAATALSKVYTLLDEIKSLKESYPDLPPVGMPQPQRWMTSENPPQNMREVLICVPVRGHLAVCLGHYNYSRKQWFLHDKYDPTEVAYWSEKPYPPEKG
jgi:hypothetical protein